jgi:hypothetical protein
MLPNKKKVYRQQGKGRQPEDALVARRRNNRWMNGRKNVGGFSLVGASPFPLPHVFLAFFLDSSTKGLRSVTGGMKMK